RVQISDLIWLSMAESNRSRHLSGRIPGTLAAAIALTAVGLRPLAVPVPAEKGTLRLHYVQKPIGYERYGLVRDGDTFQLTSDFDFTDRGGRVQLAASLKTAADFTPIQFSAKGKSYRFVNVDAEVAIAGRQAAVRSGTTSSHVPLPDRFFTVDGYAPFA